MALGQVEVHLDIETALKQAFLEATLCPYPSKTLFAKDDEKKWRRLQKQIS